MTATPPRTSPKPRSRRVSTQRRPLRVVTFLAPCLWPFYAFVTRYLAERLGLTAELIDGESYDRLDDQADVAFVCGLPYVQLRRALEPAVEPLAAPVLAGERYGGRPIYFSDVIVHRDSPFRCFGDLRGCTWAYNELLSQSGYGITRHHLLLLGEVHGYFAEVIETGWHHRSIETVGSGEADASAVDSQVLALMQRERPDLAKKLRVIDVLGPSPIQPVVAVRRLPESLKADLQAMLLQMADDPEAQTVLEQYLVQRFVPVTDEDYADILHMLELAEARGFLKIA